MASAKYKITEEDAKTLAELRQGQDALGLVGIVAASTSYRPVMCGWPRKSPASLVLAAMLKKDDVTAKTVPKASSPVPPTESAEVVPPNESVELPPPSASAELPPTPPTAVTPSTSKLSKEEQEKYAMELQMKASMFQLMGFMVHAHPFDMHHGNQWPYPCGLFILFTIKMYMVQREIAAREAAGIFDDGTRIPIKTAHMYWLANLQDKNLVKCLRAGDVVLAQHRAMAQAQ